jgi:hypothetical protein
MWGKYWRIYPEFTKKTGLYLKYSKTNIRKFTV